jgi:hypothetical protein
MSAEKEAVEMPPTYTASNDVVKTSCKAKWWQNKKKKRTVIGVVTALIISALISTTIQVSIYLVTEAQKDIVKFNLEFEGKNGETAKQDVTSDPNANVVTYHVTRGDQDVYIVDDFNQGIQTVKIQAKAATNCFVMPLNRSAAAEPSSITGAEKWTGNTQIDQKFVMEPTPVANRAFLTKKSATMCKDVSLYWTFRQCGSTGSKANTTALVPHREKRNDSCVVCCYEHCYKVWFVTYCHCIYCRVC